MATTDNSKKSGIINLADEIKRTKSKSKEGDLSKDIVELQSLIETLKKEREKNTVSAKYMQRLSTKMDKATNPSTYLRAVMPKFFETFHQNLDTYDKERKAQKEIEKIQAENRKKELKELTSSLDEFIKGSENLKEIANRFGKDAARREVLMSEEIKAIREADSHYMKNMDTISDRLKTIDEDARQEWAKQKGIQLVKIVEDEPSKEALDKIKNTLSNQIEADAQRYEKERLEAKKKATDDRRNKEAMLREQSFFRKFFGGKKEEKKSDNGFLSQLLGAWTIENLIPALLKAGLVAGLLAGILEYFSNPEFKNKVDELIEAIDKNIITPMFEKLKPKLEIAWENFKTWIIDKMKEHWGWVLAGLALAFPRATLLLIDVALKGLIAAIQWAAKKIAAAVGGPVPDVDLPDKGKGPGKGGGNTPDKKSERAKRQPRDKNGRFTKKAPGGKGVGRVGTGLGILSLFGLAANMFYTSDDEMMTLADAGFSESKVFDLLTDEEQDKYLELLSEANTRDQAKDFREKMMKKYDIQDTGAVLRWNEKYIQKPKVAPVPVPQTSSAVGAPGLGPTLAANPFFASQLGLQQPVVNAPQVTTNNSSNTTVVPWRSAVDPNRSIMFQNKP